MMDKDVIEAMVKVGKAVSDIATSARSRSMKRFEKEAEELRLAAALNSLKDVLEMKRIGHAWRAIISEMEETALFLKGKDMGPQTDVLGARILQSQYVQLEGAVLRQLL